MLETSYRRIREHRKALGIQLFVAVVFMLVGFSCVTNRKYQMMQKNDVNKQNMKSDSVVRRYEVEKFDYKIQTNDILNVRFESLTQKNMTFFPVKRQFKVEELLEEPF